MRLHQLTVKGASQGLRSGEFSSVELTEACLKRIYEIDRKINAFITINDEKALKQAEESDRRRNRGKSLGPIDGVPFSIKDNFCTKNLLTTASSNILKNFIPPHDATVVRKLKEAGAILIGKTNMDAFAHGSSTETSDFFTTKNPWDTSRLPGGSSGGSAASVAADEVIFSVGSETAGSIRQPASWCGITGLKPTYGRVSRYGVVAMGSSLDSPGPLTKTVWDAAVILKAFAGKDSLDAATSQKPTADYQRNLGKNVKGLKMGVPKEYLRIDLEEGVRKAFEEAINVLKSLGAEMSEVSLLDPQIAVAVYTIIQRSEVSSNLARYDGIRFGNPRSSFGEEAKRRIMLGTYTLSAGYYDEYYKKAQKVRTLIVEAYKKAFGKVDLIVGPTSPSVALPLGATENAAMFGELQDILVEASALSGLPAVNVSCGFSANLPVGLQICAPQFEEEKVLQAAYAYEQATDWHKRRPKI